MFCHNMIDIMVSMENGAAFLPLMDLVLDKARIAPLQREGGRQSLCTNYKGRLIGIGHED